MPKLRDSISYLYIDHAIIEQDSQSLVIIRRDERIPVPIAATTCLMLGPGTSITHAAIKTASDNGCMLVWCGENATHFYTFGRGESYSAKNILLQATLCMNHDKHLEVAKRMYMRRFGNIGKAMDYTLQQLRGMEGIRVREAYRLASKNTGVEWNGRSYKRDDWAVADPINKALSLANSVLYSVCHAAILSLGYSPALGFIHTGKQLSFVYDVADLYKADITIPAAFEAIGNGYTDLGQSVRRRMRDAMEREKLLKKIPDDLEWIFNSHNENVEETEEICGLWDGSKTIA